jgi:hypothetical protein
MEVFEPDETVVARVRQVVEDTAHAAIAKGRASVSVTRMTDLVGDSEYDCPVVVLTPQNPQAAQLSVEVQLDDLWWVHAGDGPGSELYVGMKQDRYAVLAAMVKSVVEGRYRHGPQTGSAKRIFRTPRTLRGWIETFEGEQSPFTSEHYGRGAPETERRFQTY